MSLSYAKSKGILNCCECDVLLKGICHRCTTLPDLVLCDTCHAANKYPRKTFRSYTLDLSVQCLANSSFRTEVIEHILKTSLPKLLTPERFTERVEQCDAHPLTLPDEKEYISWKVSECASYWISLWKTPITLDELRGVCELMMEKHGVVFVEAQGTSRICIEGQFRTVYLTANEYYCKLRNFDCMKVFKSRKQTYKYSNLKNLNRAWYSTANKVLALSFPTWSDNTVKYRDEVLGLVAKWIKVLPYGRYQFLSAEQKNIVRQYLTDELLTIDPTFHSTRGYYETNCLKDLLNGSYPVFAVMSAYIIAHAPPKQP